MNRSVGGGARLGFLLAFAALLGTAALSYRNTAHLAETERLVTKSHEVLDGLARALSALKDAETGYRGHHITGETVYLEPYEATVQSMPRRLERLGVLIADSPEQRRRLEVLKGRAADVLAYLHDGIALFREQGAEASRQHMLGGVGKRKMDAARAIAAEMDKAERERLAVRSAEARSSYQIAIESGLTAILICLGTTAAAFLLATRELAARARAEQGLGRAYEEMEVRVRARTAELEHANDALRASNRDLEQFASVASHDLQEPLRKIQAFGDRLESRMGEALGEQGRDYLGRMLASAARMRTLINDLLTFSRVTTRAQPFVTVDLGAVAREVASDLEGRLHDTGGRLEIGDLPTVEADPSQMRQLFQNLMGNGLKFHQPNVPPLVQVESRHMKNAHGEGGHESDDGDHISGEGGHESGDGRHESSEGDHDGNEGHGDGGHESGEGQPGRGFFEIQVRDNGIGFEEVYLDRIFEVFQRLHGRNEYEGTGMGLAISRKIVERHGGAITARSKPGHGATFIVTLPVPGQNRENESAS